MVTPEVDVPRIPTKVQVAAVVRSLWVQSSLNYTTMQGLGRLVCLLPVMRWLKLPGTEMAGFIKRHTGLFNSNPFVAALGIGALARLEHDRARNDGSVPEGLIERFAARVSTPLGAVGDELFWATLRPQALLLGVLVALFGGPWGAVALLACFGLWQGYYRWRSFSWGWAAGAEVAPVLQRLRASRSTKVAGIAASGCAGAVSASLFFERVVVTGPAFLCFIAFSGAFVFAYLLIHRGKQATWALISGFVWAIVASVGASVSGF